MAKSHTKFRVNPNQTKTKEYLSEWTEQKDFLSGSVVTHNTDAYIVTRDYTSSDSFTTDYNNGDLVRVNKPYMSGNYLMGPYYTRSGNSRIPTVTNGMKWRGGNWVLSAVRITAAGSGDYNDGGKPWTAYHYYLYFKQIEQ